MKTINYSDLIMLFKFAMMCYGFAFVFGSICYVAGNFVIKRVFK